MKRSSIPARVVVGVTICAVVAFAYGAQAASAEVIQSRVTAVPVIAPLVDMHQVDMRAVPSTRFQPLRHAPGFMPDLNGVSEQVEMARKRAAFYNPFAPENPRPQYDAYGVVPYTPALSKAFNGMEDSATTCPYFGGCEPPDMAVASNGTFVLQATNTSVAIYNTSGVLAAGWPKNTTKFFNIPNPAPSGCDPAGPFASDPRAFYDAKDQRFWVAFLQVEGALGIGSGCNLKTAYWVAVSKTSDPTAAWNVYSFNMADGNSGVVADFTQVGLDNQAFYFSGNMFSTAGFYDYAESFAANKAAMEAGTATTPKGLKDIKVGGLTIDTNQPVFVEANSHAYPAAGLFITSDNINSGGGQCSSSCDQVIVLAMANPLTAPSFTSVTVTTPPFTLAPLGTEPGCTQCLETFDERISATPQYEGGDISFAHETGVKNGSTTVPGIQWGQIAPTLTGNKITGAALTQSGIVSYKGSTMQDAAFPATMPDKNGNLAMVYDTMSTTRFPSAAYVSRLATDPLGTFEGAKFLVIGSAASPDSRWGDYEAASYEGGGNNRVWLAAQYDTSASDWLTFLGRIQL
jgi:hypothetical protein